MRVTSDYNLGKLPPELANEWHPTKNGRLTPYDIAPGNDRKYWWKCSEGHEWKARVSNRRYLGRGCPYCSGYRVSKENCLAVKYSEITSEWHPTRNGLLTPDNVAPMSNKKVWWLCAHNREHEWEAIVANRAKGRGCPYCAGKRVTRKQPI